MGRAGERRPATSPSTITLSGCIEANRLAVRAPPDIPATHTWGCAIGNRCCKEEIVARKNRSSRREVPLGSGSGPQAALRIADDSPVVGE